MSHTLLKISICAAAGLVAACSPSTPSSSKSASENSAEKAAIAPGSNGTLRVYSARHYDSDRLMYEAFEDQTGIRVLYREASANQLLETMKAEGESTPADLIIASDAGALWRFEDAGLTQALPEGEFEERIPERLLDDERQWVGLARRVRGIAYDPERISADQVDHWKDLSDPALEGEICVRSSTNIYNLSLMGEMIERWGQEEAQAWAEGVVNNMARQPQGGDTDQIEAVAAGLCGVAITNHYYWVRMAESSSAAASDAANSTELVFPDFGEGTSPHVNITGVALAGPSQNTDLALEFIEFLLSPEGQARLVTETKEIPVNPDAKRPQGLERIPQIGESNTRLSAFGEHQSQAQRTFDDAGWN
ncbi:extracellular solute-binding protein [Henriciella sp.]|uniref:extracellular solute-binding protein n=1 Tax=Henriciella sp. TaxID=1968823 RepID=UPI002619D978|nr:extracellular solute-binding protein [Henriciella sp.]